MEEIKKLKPLRTRHVRAVLGSLPATIDETYNRLLRQLDGSQQEAIAALQWLAFSRHPLQVEELAEACIIEPETEPQVDDKERFPPREILEISSSLATETLRMER